MHQYQYWEFDHKSKRLIILCSEYGTILLTNRPIVLWRQWYPSIHFLAAYPGQGHGGSRVYSRPDVLFWHPCSSGAPEMLLCQLGNQHLRCGYLCLVELILRHLNYMKSCLRCSGGTRSVSQIAEISTHLCTMSLANSLGLLCHQLWVTTQSS